MDGSRFDHLIRQLATRRLTRLTALRGLAAGAVASFTGLSLFGEEGAAKKDGKKTRRRRICHRTSATDPGVTRKLKAKRARRHLRKHPFDTKGRCAAAPRVGCQNNNDCTGGQVCVQNICVPCSLDSQCGGGLVCVGGACQQPPAPPQCQNNNQCSGGQVCVGGQCVDCTSTNQCLPQGQICVAGRCRGGEGCESNANCPNPLECIEDEEGDERCLLPNQGFFTCAPVTDNDCPEDVEIDGEEVDSVCVLGACVVFCPSEACDDLNGDCEAGICVDHDTPPLPSDRALKANIASVDPLDMLARVRDLPIATWNYTRDDPAIRHIGPMAQDFVATFGVGADDRHIHPIDGHGVALAAIQGLAAELERLRSENAALAARLAALEGQGEEE